jgi:hypothetical protein
LFVNLTILPINKNQSNLKAPNIELFDETLDINSTENYELSIQAGTEGFAFSLLDTIRNKYILFRSFEPDDNKYFSSEEINGLITRDDFLTRKYKKVNIIIPSKKFTLVPSQLYDPAKKETLFLFNHTNDDGQKIVSNKISEPDSFLIAALPKQIYDLILSSYPSYNPVHHIRPLLHHIITSSKSISGNYIHIHIEKEFFNLIIFSNSVLKFCNTFKYRNISDILYFVLGVFRKMGIGNTETIIFSGYTEKYDDLSSFFSLYVRNVKFAVPSGNFTFSYVFDDLELQKFLNLFTITNCE